MKLPDFLWVGEDRRQQLLVAGEAVLALALAWQTARLIWLLLAPHIPATGLVAAGAADDLAILSRFDPFFRAAPAMPTTAAAQSFRLHGVRAGGGGAGSAILGTPDGRQASFAVGDEVAPGVRLQSVAPDHVILARGGVRTPLYFPSASPGVTQEMVQP